MKAIRVTDFGGPDLLKLQDVPDPKPDSGQVLIRVKAVGVNPVDTYIRSGAYARKPNLPYTPGTDAAGIVEAVGPGVKKFKTGDRVYTNGTITGACAELALCEQSRVHPLAAKISFAQGAALGVPYGTAYRAHRISTFTRKNGDVLESTKGSETQLAENIQVQECERGNSQRERLKFRDRSTRNIY